MGYKPDNAGFALMCLSIGTSEKAILANSCYSPGLLVSLGLLYVGGKDASNHLIFCSSRLPSIKAVQTVEKRCFIKHFCFEGHVIVKPYLVC